MNQYFKITPTKENRESLRWIMTNKTFYPEATSTPALPAVVTPGFDYRQFFIVISATTDGGYIVFTRSEYTVPEFKINVIPTADWTTRYKLTVAPTIEYLADFKEIVNGRNYITSPRIFLHYDYQLVNNF